MSRKHKNIINVPMALATFGSYEFDAEPFRNNGYQIRIKIPNFPDIFFDWYHTTGSLVVTRQDRPAAGIGNYSNAEDVAKIILEKLCQTK